MVAIPRALERLEGLEPDFEKRVTRAEDRQRAREARFDHHLLKPIDFAALGEILAEVSPLHW